MLEIKNSRYELTAVRPDQYPETALPEIAFVARSNAGKSSAINKLLNRRSLARVGSTPGKTREINFYNADERFYLVDLPGYGYAGVSKTKKHSWGDMAETYLNTRIQLKLVLMMMDIRHKPSEDDIMMYEWIVEKGLQYMLIASKSDKLPRSQINARLKEITQALGVRDGTVPIAFSAQTGQGRDDVLKGIQSVIEG